MFGYMLNRRAPDISGEFWLNQATLPEQAQARIAQANRLRLRRDLQGHVTLINFWDYSRRDCIEVLPYLKTWWGRYRQFNFVILGVHTPGFAYEGSKDKIGSAVIRFGLSYPVVSDVGYETWDRYRCQTWPRNILVDYKGRKVFDRTGTLDYVRLESVIQDQLRAIHPDTLFVDPVKPSI